MNGFNKYRLDINHVRLLSQIISCSLRESSLTRKNAKLSGTANFVAFKFSSEQSDGKPSLKVWSMTIAYELDGLFYSDFFSS